MPKLWLTEASKAFFSRSNIEKIDQTFFHKVEGMYSGDVPDYIKNINSPRRNRHFDSLLKKAQKVTDQIAVIIPQNLQQKNESTTYDAWEEDIAVLNIFFGQESVLGRVLQRNKTLYIVLDVNKYFFSKFLY